MEGNMKGNESGFNLKGRDIDMLSQEGWPGLMSVYLGSYKTESKL